MKRARSFHRGTTSAVVYLAALAMTLPVATAFAGFGTVIDIPPTDDFGDNAGIGSNTQLNVHPGGAIGDSFDVGLADGSSTDVQLNVLGGVVGDELHANGGSETNVMSGTVGNLMTAFDGSVVNVSGGTVGNEVAVLGGELNISGGTVGSDMLVDTNSLVNISGGIVGPFMNIGSPDETSSGVAVNISGGYVNGGIHAWIGSSTTMTGGVLGLVFGSGGDSFNAEAFSFVEVYGGVFDYDFDTFDDADVHIYGGDFLLNGIPLAVDTATPISLGPMDILEGVLEDGTVFALGVPLNDEIAADTLTLHDAPLPPLGAMNIVVPPDPAPPSIRDGQTLTLNPSGELDELFRAGRGSTLIVQGGEVGRESQAVGASVSMSSGIIGSGFVALDSTVVITGGQVFSFFEALDGTVVDFSAGSAGTGFFARTGSEINVSGGAFGGFFSAQDGTEVNISGGTFGANFSTGAAADVNFFGGDFRLDGELIENLDNVGDMVAVNISEGSVLSGTFQDGSPFAFTSLSGGSGGDYIADGSLTLHRTDVPAANPITFNLPGDQAPSFLREGQTVVVDEGGELAGDFNDFNAGFGSAVVVNGGFVGGRIEATGANVTIAGGGNNGVLAYGGTQLVISGGSTGVAQVSSGSVAEVSGGTVRGIEALNGGVVNVSGGNVAGSFSTRALLAENGSEVNISGGTFTGTNIAIANGAVANISGGVFDVPYYAVQGSETNLFGTSFALDGDAIDGLELGVPFLVTDRDLTLTGTFDNGRPFNFDLNSTFLSTEDSFPNAAMLNVILVEPNLLPGDYNDDGIVGAADYVVWRNHLDTETLLPNDATSGMVTQEDYTVWVENFDTTASGNSSAIPQSAFRNPHSNVPEPATAILFLIAACSVAAGQRVKHMSISS